VHGFSEVCSWTPSVSVPPSNTTNAIWRRVILDRPIVTLLVKIILAFHGPRSTLPCSRQPAIRPCSEPSESSPQTSHFISLNYFLILSSHLHLGLLSGFFSLHVLRQIDFHCTYIIYIYVILKNVPHERCRPEVFEGGSAESWGPAKAPQGFREILMKIWAFCSCFCNYIYRLSTIILKYEHEVIFKNEWITFWKRILCKETWA
jgi:hypothetical protein